MAEGSTEIALKGERLLALEIRPKKAGFAVLDGATLHDWGVTRYGPSTLEIKRLASLLDLHVPSILVLRERTRMRNHQAAANIVAAVSLEARRRSIQVRSLDAREVRAFFTQRGRRNKHAVATLLAEWFPELTWKVPPKRKLWQSEPHNTLLFDAVAIAVTFLTGQS